MLDEKDDKLRKARLQNKELEDKILSAPPPAPY
jgi:hypothetical protein